jgi:hypothetical protein
VTAVTAAEVAALAQTINGAPNDEKLKDYHLFLPVVPVRDCNISLPLSVVYSRNAPEKGDPTPQGRAAPGTPTGSAHIDVHTGLSEIVGAGSGVVSVPLSVPLTSSYTSPVLTIEDDPAQICSSTMSKKLTPLNNQQVL